MTRPDVASWPSAAVRDVLRGSGLDRHATAVAVRGPDGSRAVVATGELAAADAVTGATVMYAASLAKQVIGVLVALLVRDGRLGVDDRLRLYLPELPAWADPVRVRHLLHHTSGLPEVEPPPDRLGRAADGAWDNAAALWALCEQDAPTRPAGLVHAYCNIGYVCLAEIVERTGNESVSGAAQRRLFGPLGMNRSSLGDRPDDVPAREPEPPATIGDGGLWTTAEDLLRWNEALNARVLDDEVQTLVETPGRLDDGTPLSYAWGMNRTWRGGGWMYTHGGTWPGRCAKAVRRPSAGVAVALLTACDDVARVSDAGLAVSDRLTDGPPTGPSER